MYGRVGLTKLVCFDATTDIINGIKEGVIDATVAQREFDMGFKSVQLIYLIATEGEEAAVSEMGVVDGIIDTGVDVITQAILKEYEDESRVRRLDVSASYGYFLRGRWEFLGMGKFQKNEELGLEYRLLAGKLLAVQEAERRRLAREQGCQAGYRRGGRRGRGTALAPSGARAARAGDPRGRQGGRAVAPATLGRARPGESDQRTGRPAGRAAGGMED